MTSGITGHGVVVEYNNGTAYVEVIEVTTVPDLGNSGGFVDATHLNSPSRTKEYVAGLKDPPDFELSAHWVSGNADQVALQVRADAQTPTDFRVTYPNGAIASFTCALSGWNASAPGSEDMLSFTVSGKVTGAVTWS